jgi:hypothetical protein
MDERKDPRGDDGMQKIGDATVLDASSRRIVELKMDKELCHLAFSSSHNNPLLVL